MELSSTNFSGQTMDWSPNDWPDSFPELRTIDNLLRCSICYEYFNVALVIPECCHNYCSLCIRKSLGFQAQCPTCCTVVSPPDLRNNRVLDELVKNFIKIRVKLLELVRNNSEMRTVEKHTQEKGDSVQAKRAQVKRQMQTPSRSSKRQKIGMSPVACDNRANMANEVLVIDESPPTSPDPKQVQGGPSREDNVTSLSECPVCGEMVNTNRINSHLDFCLIRSEKKSALRSSKQSKSSVKKLPSTSRKSTESTTKESTIVSGEPSTSTCGDVSGSNAFVKTVQKKRPLPKLVYKLMSEKELRQQLKKWSLPNKGDRQALIRRHKEFVVRYNAECDSSKPKSVSEIAEEIERTEKAMLKASSTRASTSLHFKRDTTEEEMDNARQQYLKEHKDEFTRLIDDARRRGGHNPSRSKEKKRKENFKDIPPDQTSNQVSQQPQDPSLSPPEDKGTNPGERDQGTSFELLPELNEAEGGQGHDPEDTGELHESATPHLVPEPPLTANLDLLQDEEVPSSPSLGFEEEDQECSEVEDNYQLESSSPVIRVGRNTEADQEEEEFEF